MLICLPLACVWPWSVDNYSSLALTCKLIMKDKQRSTCQLPKCLILNSRHCQQSCRFWAPNPKTCSSLCVWSFLHLHCLFPTFDEMKVEGLKKKTTKNLLLVATLPGFTSHSIAGVPISCSLASTAVFLSEEAAGWGLTGCCGTERRLWHPRYRLKIQ